MEKSKKAWLNALFLIVTLVINTFGAIGLINGLSQKQISDMYLTLLTPSSSTFSIWSVIYALLIASVIAMIVRKNDPYYQKAIDELSVLFWLSCIFNIVWIIVFSFVLIELATIFILAFVITLSLLCVKLLKIQERKRWLLPLAFGLYTGWLVIATVVNISAALVKLNWSGFGIAYETWAAILLIIAVFLVAAILFKIKNAAFPLPVAWAFLGINQFLQAPQGFKGEYGLLQTLTLVGMVIFILLAIIQFIRNRYALLPVKSNSTNKTK